MRDFRVAFRSLARQPIFTLAAVLTLALGIGANTAIFSVFNTVVLRPLPFRDPGRLVLVWQQRPDGRTAGVSALNYREWVKQASSFEQLLGMYQQYYSYRTARQSTQVLGAQVPASLFRTLGIQALIGRTFTTDEDQLSAPRVVLFSHGFWQDELGADPSVIGRSVDINAQSYTVVGVLPEAINSAVAFKNVQVWTPLAFDSNFRMTSNTLAVLGRLKPDLDIQQANREMQVVAKNLESEFPDLDKGWSATVTSLQGYGLADIRASLLGIQIAVGFILLIACVNVANLLLARAEMRQGEMAIRSALGARRTRLLRELFAEHLLLALAGALAGLAIAHGALRLLIVFGAGQLPRIQQASLDGSVLAFTLALSVLTAFLFGLFPARQLFTIDLNRTLRQAGRGSIHAGMGRRSRDLLVVSQVALSLILVAGAGLMVRSLLWLQTESRGFAPQRLLSLRVSVLGPDLSGESRMPAAYLRMLSRLTALPGVKAVASATNLPLDGYLMIGEHFRVEGVAPTTLSERPSAACNLVNAGYFKSIGTPILAGREFDERDRDNALPVAVISATLARRFFPGQNPIGHKIVVPTPGKPVVEVARDIVGVAADIRYLTRKEEDSAEIYLPYLQAGWPVVYVMLRTEGDPKLLAPSVRAALGSSGLELPIAEVRTMEERIAELNGKPRLNSILALVFSGMALALAAVGIYGVVSYSTVQRSQEIGVRMAIGASAGAIVAWIMRQALALTIAGVILGLAGHFVLSRVLGSLLYGVSANDATTLVTAIAVLSLIAILASYIPARRAAAGDPTLALRAE